MRAWSVKKTSSQIHRWLFLIRSSNTSTKDSKSKSYPFCASNRPMKPEQGDKRNPSQWQVWLRVCSILPTMQRTKWNQNVGTQIQPIWFHIPKILGQLSFFGDVFHSKAKAFSGNHLVLPEVLRSFLKSEDSCCTLLHHVFGKGCWRRMNHMSWCSNFLKSFLFRNTSLMPETINYESMPMFSWWTLNDRLFPQQHRFDSLVTPFVVKFPSITP